MKTALCDLLGIDLPVTAFSHCRDVVAAVSKAGGCGVLGATLMTPEELDTELTWIDAQVGGRPYGVDLIIPKKFTGKGNEAAAAPELFHMPDEIRGFVDQLLQDHQMDPDSIPPTTMASAESMSEERAAAMIDVACDHGVALMANALGVPPTVMFEKCRSAGVAVGALSGTRAHAEAQAAAGVDFVVAQGYEAGGHTGQVATMVLVPEVVEALPSIPVLAAGGIVTGRQVAAAIALGAAGVWTGSVWLTTHEAETSSYVKQKMLAASSSDTVRSRYRTGKPSRQLRSEWHDAWERNGSPSALPMPFMGYVCEPPLRRADVLADQGHQGAQQLATYWVGQGVGLMRSMRSVREVMSDLVEGYVDGLESLTKSVQD